MKPETEIQIHICSSFSVLSQSYNFMFFSVPNEGFLFGAATGGVMSPRDHARLMVLKKMGLTQGVADLVIIKDGKAYFMEVKAEKGKQSEAQIIFADWCKATSTPYMVVRSVNEAIDALKFWGVIK